MDSIVDTLAGSAPAQAKAPNPRNEALRAEVARIKETRQCSLTEIAREAGVHPTTFSAWNSGTYGGRNDRVDDQVALWLESREAGARARATMPTGPGFVVTQASQVIMAALEHAQHAPDLAVISGAAGVGKTSSAGAYRLQSPNVWVVTAEPCLTTPRALLSEIAQTMGIDEWRTSGHISRAVVRRLQGSRGLVILDEAQHVKTEGLDQLRTIHDRAGVGVAIMGNEAVAARLEGTRRSTEYAQIFSRVGIRITRAKPTKGDVDPLLDAWEVTGAEERKLLRAISRKPGALRLMIKVLRIARMQAAGGGEALSARVIEMAYGQLAASPLEGGAA